MTAPPDTWVEWLRFLNAMTGIAAFGLLLFRLIGHWDDLPRTLRGLVTLLALAVLANGLGSARAEVLDAPFNELAYLGLTVNTGALLVALLWHRSRLHRRT